ncbi:hypothetical protein SCAR479_13474 [Seiridium cardinale]|uniref:Uncharacterized protein n=1 Tax=Seiridium cardinale TaxID=138064 RepID=A0ABR2X7W8_9PEZI
MTQALFMNEGRGAMVEIMPDTGYDFHRQIVGDVVAQGLILASGA